MGPWTDITEKTTEVTTTSSTRIAPTIEAITGTTITVSRENEAALERLRARRVASIALGTTCAPRDVVIPGTGTITIWPLAHDELGEAFTLLAARRAAAEFARDAEELAASMLGMLGSSSVEVDPLDAQIDSVSLRELLSWDEDRRRETGMRGVRFTIAQRQAISAHWSAELAVRVAESAERERRRVTIEIEP